MIASIIITAISALWVFVVRRGNPEKQNTATFYSGLACVIFGLVMIYNNIRTFKDKEGQYVCRGSLGEPGWTRSLLDLVGVGLAVEFFGMWWENAAYLFIAIPVFIIYSFIMKVRRWLTGF